MPLPVSVHDQNSRSGVCLLDLIRQVMPVVSRQRWTENYQVERSPSQCLFHSFASDRCLYLVTRFLNGRRL